MGLSLLKYLNYFLFNIYYQIYGVVLQLHSSYKKEFDINTNQEFNETKNQ